MRYLVRAAVNAFGLWLATVLVPGISMLGHGDAVKTALYFLVAGAILGVVNFFVRPVVVLLSVPFYLLTLGLFFLIVNAAMLMIAANLTSGLDMGLIVGSWTSAIFGGIVLSIVNVVVNPMLPEKYQKR